jgi:hypothetical protein
MKKIALKHKDRFCLSYETVEEGCCTFVVPVPERILILAKEELDLPLNSLPKVRQYDATGKYVYVMSFGYEVEIFEEVR